MTLHFFAAHPTYDSSGSRRYVWITPGHVGYLASSAEWKGVGAAAGVCATGLVWIFEAREFLPPSVWLFGVMAWFFVMVSVGPVVVLRALAASLAVAAADARPQHQVPASALPEPAPRIYG